MTAQSNKAFDSYWLSVAAILALLFVIVMTLSKPPVGPIPACYDTGEVQVVSVHNSGIQSTIEYQYEVQCNNGESYWRSK